MKEANAIGIKDPDFLMPSFKCSNCGFEKIYSNHNYCANCGYKIKDFVEEIDD